MIRTLKRLTDNNEKLNKEQCLKIRGLGGLCAEKCDWFCGTKKANDGSHYSSQRSFIEGDPIV